RWNQRFFFESAPDDAGPVASSQNGLIFARVENFIDTLPGPIEHPQPRLSGAFDGVRNRAALVLPPSLFGVEDIAMRNILKSTLQKAERRPQRVEAFHFPGMLGGQHGRVKSTKLESGTAAQKKIYRTCGLGGHRHM